ncbi:endonuclease/exonuclease/phosphatase family protein [Paenarthrobacter sp. NPDC092416]|uniref:endonuclease/exonuclease/phosphatase family protein n=1 Tax=Paenarthrobacter sp. NPDC092416 TaxID=3364386 RepID=UPI003819D220
MTKPSLAAPSVRPRKLLGAPAWSVLAVLVALPVAGLSLFRAIPTEWPLQVVQLLSFTPWLVLPAALALVLALLGRRVWAMITTAALLGAQLFWLFPLDYGRPVMPSGSGQPAAVTVSAMSVNSEYGEADAAAIVRLVRENGVELLAIQEHTQGLEDRLQTEGLGEVLPNRLSDPTDDASGSALYSKFPLEAAGMLPDTPFQMPTVRVTVASAGAKSVLTVTTVHALPPVDSRIAQWRSDLAAVARQASRPGNQLLMGDFNATYDHHEFRDLLDSGPDGSKLVDVGVASGSRLTPTWPREGPPLPGIVIDHMVTTPRISSSGYMVRQVPGTDHAAILATLSIPAG